MERLKDALLFGGLSFGCLIIYIVVAQFTDNPLLRKASVTLLPVLFIFFLVLAGLFFKIKDTVAKHKKIKNKEIIYESFGDGVAEFVYSLGQWNVNPKTPITITLFDKTYPISFSFASESPADGITDYHYKAYDDCMAAIGENRIEIEKIIENYYIENYELTDKQVLLSEFEVHSLEIDKIGQYVLFGDGPENGGDEGFVLIIKPELDMMTHTEYWSLCHY